MLIVDPQLLCIHLLLRILWALLTAGRFGHFHVVPQPLGAGLDGWHLRRRDFVDLLLDWFGVVFLGRLWPFVRHFSLAFIGDLLGLFRRRNFHPPLKLQFAMPSLNDRIPRPVALEVLPDQRPVARPMLPYNPRQLLVLLITPLQ